MDLQAGNCAKECQLNREKPQEVKGNSYKLSKTNGKSAKHIYLPPTNLGSRSDAAQGQLLWNCHYAENALTGEGLSNLV